VERQITAPRLSVTRKPNWSDRLLSSLSTKSARNLQQYAKSEVSPRGNKERASITRRTNCSQSIARYRLDGVQVLLQVRACAVARRVIGGTLHLAEFICSAPHPLSVVERSELTSLAQCHACRLRKDHAMTDYTSGCRCYLLVVAELRASKRWH
jgi:hypothetical protein